MSILFIIIKIYINKFGCLRKLVFVVYPPFISKSGHRDLINKTANMSNINTIKDTSIEKV